jgi:hypothetical protein
MRPQHNSITEMKWLKRPYFSLENLPIASYYLHFPPQLRSFSLISLSPLSMLRSQSISLIEVQYVDLHGNAVVNQLVETFYA